MSLMMMTRLAELAFVYKNWETVCTVFARLKLFNKICRLREGTNSGFCPLAFGEF